MPGPINMRDREGNAVAVPEEQIANALASGWHVEDDAEAASRVSQQAKEEAYGGIVNKGVALGAGVARGFTGGGSDVLLGALGEGETLRNLREVHRGASLVGEIAGGLGGAGKIAGAAGAKLAGTGGGAAAQIARAGVKGTVEGGIIGAGQGVTELALSEDPLSFERIASVIGSNALFGAATGGALGAAGKGVERGLVRAKAALDDVANRRTVGQLGELPEDLATLDRKGLRAAEKTELDAIEAARVPKRAELADEIKVFRQELKENKLWLATKGAEEPAIRAIGKRTLKADRALDNLLDDPKALAENPRAALSHLRKQEAALDDLVNKHGDDLRTKFAGDASGDRAKALDYASAALERNRALQAKLTELSAKPTSARLQQIGDAMDGLNAPKPEPGFAGQMLQGSVFGHVAGAVSGIPIIGPMLGAKAARLVGDLVGGKLGAASAQAAKRGSQAVQAFLDVGHKVAPSARIAATKVLTSVAYAQTQDERPRARASRSTKATPAKAAASLATAFKARSQEIRSLVMPGPDGKPMMQPTAREQMAARLAPIYAANPLLADRIETTKARGIEFLASKIPKRPDVFGAPVGPDRWQPSDMEMRAWARYVAAVEDPHGVIERLADGTVTPEDAETMRTVYPEMYMDIQRQISEQLPTLRATLPYQRRLAYSIFSGVPVEPALDPRILGRLQASFAAEEGTAGGVQAPRAQPQFGSISRDKGTPSEERAAGGA